MSFDLAATGAHFIAGTGDGSSAAQALVQQVQLAADTVIDGSIKIAAGAPDTVLFGGAVPLHGYMIQNNTGDPLWWNDTGNAASATAAGSFQLAPGAMFITPANYIPAGAVHVSGGTPDSFVAARKW